MEHGDTKTSVIGKDFSKSNKYNSFYRNNTTRRASRQSNFEGNYQAKKASLGAGGCG